ncbi:MAG TPA: type I-C CRISPR-associated protein Cas8c/Csd1 [Syntrophus sp. (in: bacteria)]|nr:type I-C CRISPR-associated protein Cas8c/Csd1 [Syntrophus sp. (in: bacteria)]
MLEALINYVDRGEPPESGYKPKDVRWAICCNEQGEFLEVIELGDVSQKTNRGQEFTKCPDFSFSEMKAQGITKSHFLVETAEVVTLHSKNPEDRKTHEKHSYFFSMLKEAGMVMPELQAIAAKMANHDVLAGIREKLAELKAKPTDKVTLRIGSKFPLESSLWHSWWQEWRSTLITAKSATKDKNKSEPTNTVRCFITGELIEPVRVSPKISGLSDVGGMSAGDSLCSFKQESFCSYGFEQAYNAAVSESATNAYRAALDELIKKHGRRLAGAKVIHWFKKKDLPKDDDPLAWLVESEEQQNRNAQQLAKELLTAIKTGKRPDLTDNFFYALTLSGASGRVMIRDWMEGQFEELVTNIMNWFDDFAIAHRASGGLAPNPKFMAVLGATVQELDNLNGPFVTKMWRTAVKNELIPEYALAQVLSRFKVDIIEDTPVNHAAMGLMKAYHLRKERKKGGETMVDDLKPYLNEAHPHSAYHCGRLMAVLADLQRAAMGDVGAGVVQRYFAAASSTPALVLGRLTRNSQAHLNKLTGGRAYRYEEKIAAIWGRIKDSLPKTLTLEEQSLFALGYYQQMADMRKKTSENTNKEKEEGKNE